MQILSVNIGKLEKLGGAGSAKFYPANTGIFKNPVLGPVFVGKLGLQGDKIGNPKHHGGEDQAVYLYSQEDYAFWDEKLGKTCQPGLFGENLTVAGLISANAHVGDQYRFGDLVLEVTSPRIPCSTLAARMGAASFPKSFMRAKRPGIYCRVLIEGVITAGQIGMVEKY